MQCIKLKEFYQNLHPCFQYVEIFVIVLVLGQILALLLEYARAGEPELLEKKNQEPESLGKKSGAGDAKKLAGSSALR